MTLSKFSKENRWYYQEIDGHIKPESRKLLEEYSQIPSGDVYSHVYTLRDKLWDQAPFPCIGEFKFLTLNLPSHPKYQQVLSTLGSHTSTSSPIELLDLGCCVAQELRSLTYAGIPSSQLYGSDIVPRFLSTSYELFNDADRFKGTLVVANAFDTDVFEKAWKDWGGKFEIIHAGLFLHLFNWDQQLSVCDKIVKLISKEKGALFLGEMVGCEGSGERGEGKGGKFWKKDEERKQFLHDEVSFEKMWGEVAERTGTVGCWKVEGSFKKRARASGDGSHGCAFFTGEGIGWLTFSVERL